MTNFCTESFDFTHLSKRNLRYARRLVVHVANGASFVALDMPLEEMHQAANVLYLHRHRATKKCYLGITVQPAANRWFSGIAYRNNRRFGPALKKHGWEGFESFILAFGDERDALNRAEVAAIAAAGGHKSKHTYNLSPGGDTVAENDKPIVGVNLTTGEQRDFKSGSEAARQLGMHNSDMPMAIARGERVSVRGWWFRFAEDIESKPPESWGEALRVRSVRLRQAKNVVGLNLESGETQVFPSTGAAAAAVGAHQSQVSAVINGHAISAAGWWFKLEDDERNPPEIYGQKAGRLMRDKKVYARHLTTGVCREFRNCTVADTELNLYMGAAAAVSAGARTSAGGWWFTFEEKSSPPRAYGAALVATARSKAVIAIEVATGSETRFESAKAAAAALSMSRAAISFVISGKLQTAKGYKFRLDD
jgi:hypothetical protein